MVRACIWETMPRTPGLSSCSFGEDALGNLLVTDGGGKIYAFHSDGTTDDLICKHGVNGVPWFARGLQAATALVVP